MADCASRQVSLAALCWRVYMYGLVSKIMSRAGRRLAVDLGWARRHFARQRGAVRLLTYHGLVPDTLADRPWVPSHYVSVLQFERQMAMLAELGTAPLLGAALRALDDDPEASPVVCLTFDDGMADNVTLANPILSRFGHRATFFLTTGYMERHGWLPNDIIRMLRPLHQARQLGRTSDTLDRIFAQPGYAKTLSVADYLPELTALWANHQHEIDPAAREHLYTMTWDQARHLQRAGMELGAHTVNHVILGREPADTRRREILESIARMRSNLNLQAVPFSYPNGLAGDYGTDDIGLLAAVGVPYATTELAGWNDASTPRYELRRNCVGRHCSDRAFMAMVCGIGEQVEANEPACTAGGQR